MENTLALAGAIAFVLMGIAVERTKRPLGDKTWLIPAVAAAGFLLFSIFTISQEGPTGFWVEHTRNLWGNQIWFDLICAASVAWSLLVPRAKACGMQVLPWLVIVLCTGSVGLLTLLARVLYLEGRSHQRIR